MGRSQLLLAMISSIIIRFLYITLPFRSMKISETILSASLAATIPFFKTASLSTGIRIILEGNVYAHWPLSSCTWVFLESLATKFIHVLMSMVSWVVLWKNRKSRVPARYFSCVNCEGIGSLVKAFFFISSMYQSVWNRLVLMIRTSWR